MVRIEHLNGKVKVLIDGVPNLIYNYGLNFKSDMGQSSEYFFFGLTGSTGEYYQNQRIKNFRFWTIKPSGKTSEAYPILKRSFKVLEVIQIGVILYDGCKNYFKINPTPPSMSETFEGVNKLDWEKPATCDFVGKRLENKISEYNPVQSQFIFEVYILIINL